VSFLRILLSILLIFFAQVSTANECDNFEEKVLSIPIPTEGYVTDGQQPKYDLGIFFHQDYDYQYDKIVIKRNKENFPIIKISFIEKNIKPFTAIKRINGNDLSKLKDIEILDLIELTEATVETQNNQYKISAIEYDLYPFDLEYFSILAIDEIKTKEGEFQLDYAFQVIHERPDWIEAGREIGNLTVCPVNELTENNQIYSPVTNETIYLKQIGFDQDKNFSSYDQVYYEDLDKTYTRANYEGIARIKADFDLKKFPFDEQNLKMELTPPYGVEYNEGGNYPKPFITTFQARKDVYLGLDLYKNKNYLKEWTIKNVTVENVINSEKMTSSFDREKIIQYQDDRIILNINVKRNINYFIFKIIIPVFLILTISWSVMWIPPNQVESRLTTSIVALLALIAYNFVFNEDIPKLSYLTSLDRYILLSYLFCAIPTFLTVYFSRITKKDYKIALEINKKSRLIGIIIYSISAAVIFSV